MLLVFCRVVGVDENVIEVDGNIYVEEITKDVIHESLESSWSIGQSERHNKPFEGSVASPECCLPFVTFRNADKMVGVMEINGGVEAARRSEMNGSE